MSKQKIADIIIVIDESGSMSSMGSEPLQALNEFITEQQENAGESRLSLYAFSSKVRKIYEDVILSSIAQYTDYNPSGVTALYDAIGIAISDKVKSKHHDNTVLVVITDGEDNSSKEFTSESIKKRIKHMEDVHNWQVVFLAANQDAFATGQGYGVKYQKCNTFSMQKGSMLGALRSCSSAVKAYRHDSANVARPTELSLTLSEED